MQNLPGQLKNRRPLAKLAGLVAKQEVQGNFRRQKNADGTRWPRLKTREGTPLVSGRGRIPKGIVDVPSDTGFIIAAGSETKAFNAVHNFGSRTWHDAGQPRDKYVPQRQFMYLAKESVRKVERVARDYVRRMIKGNR